MSFFDKILKPLRLQKRVTGSLTLTSDPDEEGRWIDVTSDIWDAGLSEFDQIKMIDRSLRECYTNPFARRVVETIVNFVVGSNIRISANNETVAAFLNEFWNHPRNNMAIRAQSQTRDLVLFGEEFVTLEVNQNTGMTFVGSMNPKSVTEVIVNQTNHEEAEYIRMGHGEDSKLMKVVFDDQYGTAGTVLPELYGKVKGRTAGKKVGEILYWKVNSPSGAKRGISDLLTVLDPLNSTKRLFAILMDRAKLANMLVFKCKIKGASEKDLLVRADKSSPKYVRGPKPGGIVWENDDITWDVLQTNIQASDMSETARLFLLPVSAGTGLSINYFGTVEDMNRAGVLESNSPIHKMLSTRQAYEIACFEELCQVALDNCMIFRPDKLTDKETGQPIEDLGFTLSADEIGMRDETARAGVMRQEIGALVDAYTQGGLAQKQFIGLIQQALQSGGMDFKTIEMKIEEVMAEVQKQNVEVPPEKLHDNLVNSIMGEDE